MSIVHASTIIGAAAPVPDPGLKLSNGNLSTTQTTPTPATCTVSLSRMGLLTFAAQTEPADPSDEWFEDHTDATRGDDYEVQLTVNSGDSPTSGPAVASFHTLDAVRSWQLATSGPMLLTGSWNIEVREIAVPANTVNANFGMTSEEEVS